MDKSKFPFFDVKLAEDKKKYLKYADIRPGDIALFKGNSFISKLIIFVTRGYVSHAALVIGKDEIIHARNTGIIKQKLSEYLAEDSKMTSYLKRIKLSEFKDDAIHDQIEKVIKYAEDKIGMEYDWINIWALFWRSLLRRFGLWRIARIKYFLDNKRLRFICSEFIVESYKIIGIDLTTIKNPQPALTTPQDLYKSNKVDFICNL